MRNNSPGMPDAAVTTTRDYYEVLGVPRDAGLEIVAPAE